VSTASLSVLSQEPQGNLSEGFGKISFTRGDESLGKVPRARQRGLLCAFIFLVTTEL
jgi:hypothetical protein